MVNLYNFKNRSVNSQPPETKEDKASEAPKKITDFTKYVKPGGEGLSAKELKWGLWLKKHEVLLYKFLVGFLIIFIIINIVFSFWRWGVFITGISKQQILDKQLLSFINYSSGHSYFGAQPLQIMGVQVLAGGVNKYDIIAEVYNPNDDFITFFSYYFTVGNDKTVSKNTFLLPGEARPVAILGIDSGTVLNSPTLTIENLHWQRVSAHEIKDAKSWQDYRLDFKISSTTFMAASAKTGSGPDANVIQFKLTNSSPYNYKESEFYIGLYQGSSFVGLLPLRLDSFKSLETKDIDVRSFVTNLNINNVVIYPLINVYNKNVYF